MTFDGDALTVVALAELHKSGDAEKLSPFGAALFDISLTAIEAAAGGTAIAQIGLDAADAVFEIAQPLISEALGELSQAIPLVGQAIGFVFAIADAAAAQEAAEHSKTVQACIDQYLPILPKTSATGFTPADVLGITNGYKSKVKTTDPIPETDVGRMFAALVETHTYYEVTVNGKASSFADPVYLAKLRATLGKYAGGKDMFDGAKGVPKGTRDRLQALRGAITMSRGAGLDGGRAAFPVYLDLLWAQFKNKNLTKAFAWFVFKNAVSGQAGGVNCWEYDRRAFDQFWEILRNWKLTIEPIYTVDQTKLAVALQQAKSVIAARAGLALPNKNFPATAKAILGPKKIRPIQKLPGVTPMSRIRPLHKLSIAQGMSAAEHQRIIATIIAAAHGDSIVRETHIDDDLDANTPAPVLDVHSAEDLDGGDEYSFYGEVDEEGYDCYGEHVDEDDVDDPWGYTFPELSTGASRASMAQKKGIIFWNQGGIVPSGIKQGFDPQPDPPGSLQGFDPQPDPPKGYVGALKHLKKVPVKSTHPAMVQQKMAAAKKAAYAAPPPKQASQFQQLAPQTAKSMLAKTSKPSIIDMARVKALKVPQGASPMPRPTTDSYEPDADYYDSAPDYDFDGYQEPDVNAYADGEASTLDYEDEETEYDGGYAQYSGEEDSTDWGYGYGDYGSEEDYPHDGSTYGWEDCW